MAAWSAFGRSQTFHSLPQTEAGADRLSTLIAKALDITEDAVDYLQDRPKAEVFQAIEVRPTDIDLECFVVYVATHGIPHGDELYLATSASQGRHDLWNALSADELFDVVGAVPAKVKVVILDSCFAGSAVGIMSDASSANATEIPAPELTIGEAQPGIFVLTSCSGVEISYARPDDLYSVFTESLISILESDALRVAAISPRRLAERVIERVAVRSTADRERYPRPRFQDTDGVGEVPIFGNRQPTVATAGQDTTNYRVLVVAARIELVEQTLELFRRVCQKRPELKIEVIGHNAEPGAHLALDGYFDLVITELFLATSTAAVLLRNAKNGSPNTRTIVLCDSTSAEARDLDEALVAILQFPPSVDGFLIKGSEQPHLANVVASEAARRTRVLDNTAGTEDLVADVVNRMRRRRRMPDAAGDGAVRAEARAVVAELFRSWLDPDEWGDAVQGGAEPLVTHVRLTPIDEGRSTCVVYQAEPSISAAAETGPTRMAVKVGPREEIDQELDRYRRYVAVGIPLKQRSDVVASWQGRNLGGILFSFLGDPSNPSRDEPMVKGIGDKVENMIVSVLGPNNSSWHSVTGLDKKQFFSYYAPFKFDQQKAIAAIGAAALSVKRINDRGGVSEVLPIPQTGWLREPVITGSWPSTLVHGDLHLGNVVSLGANEFALIDYRNVGPGPRCIDFAAAELSLLLRPELPAGAERDLVNDVRHWLEATSIETTDATPEAPSWLSETDHYVRTLRQSLVETFAGKEPLSDDEFFSCLFVVALRRSRFKGLATTKDEKRAERVLINGAILGCAGRLGFK